MMRRRLLFGMLGTLTASLFHTRAHAHALSPAIENWAEWIAEASHRFGVPDAWIKAVMQAESAGRTHVNGRPIRSKAGGMGLMQLMPGTWSEMRRRHALGPDPDDPRDNILAGTAYLRAMYDRFGYPGLFAAYNAGPARYLASLSGARLPTETVDYLAKLTRSSLSTGGRNTIFPAPTPVKMPVQAAFDRRLFAIKRDVEQAGKPSP